VIKQLHRHNYTGTQGLTLEQLKPFKSSQHTTRYLKAYKELKSINIQWLRRAISTSIICDDFQLTQSPCRPRLAWIAVQSFRFRRCCDLPRSGGGRVRQHPDRRHYRELFRQESS